MSEKGWKQTVSLFCSFQWQKDNTRLEQLKETMQESQTRAAEVTTVDVNASEPGVPDWYYVPS